MRAYSCDRCSRALTSDEILALHTVRFDSSARPDFPVWDMCRDCYEFFIQFLENKNAHATPTDQDEVAPEDGPGPT